MNEAVRFLDFVNIASMLVIPVAGLGYLWWRDSRSASSRQHASTTFFETPYVPIAIRLLANQQKGEEPKPAGKVVPITAAVGCSR